jgi:hypothetical protein
VFHPIFNPVKVFVEIVDAGVKDFEYLTHSVVIVPTDCCGTPFIQRSIDG